MSNGKQAEAKVSGWTLTQAYVMAAICLLLGIAMGYLFRGSATAEPKAAAPVVQSAPPAMPQITPEQLKQMADKQAEPLQAQLKANPNNGAVLTSLGNLYYDARQYQEAVGYYERALKITPENSDVRTDMGTAYWYMGEADKAIAEFQTVLRTQPTKANTLFNLGVVQWQGKMDGKAAAATWQKLLDNNPNYEGNEQVRKLLAQVKQHSDIKPGTTTSKPAM